MKSVLFSEIVHAPRASGLLGRLSPLAVYGAGAALALPLLVLVLRRYGPGAPLASIVLPLLAVLALPLCAVAPGRLEIRTRFDARHMHSPLDDALGTLGYTRVNASADRIRYACGGAWRRRTHDLNVRMGAHTLDITGPIPTLRALQAALAAPGLVGTARQGNCCRCNANQR